MKKILFFICFVALAGAACQKEAGLGAPTEIAPVYTLPQPGTSPESSAWFVKMHNDYGSYFIWDFTEKDALWTIIAGGNMSDPDRNYITPGDPEYADEMIEYVKSVWLNHVSEERLRSGGMPFRVFLADSVGQIDSTRIPQGAPAFYNPSVIRVISANSIILSGMNRNLPAMTPAQRTANTITVLKTMFPAPAMPAELYEVSDYTTRPSWLPGGAFYESVTPGNTAALNVSGSGMISWTAPSGIVYTYDRELTRRRMNEEIAKRGFIMSFNPSSPLYLFNPMISYPMNTPTQWTTEANITKNFRDNDNSYQWDDWLWKATDEQLAASGIFDEVAYPLLWRKWQIRIQAYLDAGLDVRAVANGQ